jgi:succinate dehydrogenase / fumarate reductase, cytochrome b subunit
MQKVATLYRSSVGKKILMAVSGIVLVGFIVVHMLGNLKVFQGDSSFNAYAEFIREVGYPALPHQGALWLIRIALLVAVAVHITMAVQLWQMSSAARERRYQKNKDLSFSYASRTMRWGGVIILLFLVYHILHFTTGQAHPDFVLHDAHHNFVTAFQVPWVVLVYVVAQAALCLHLYHGVWSLFQTLGANHPRYNRYRRPFAAALAIGVFVGFVVPPIMVLARVVS